MSMLYAGTHEFKSMYPTGAYLFDRLGRKIENVIACDPKTGEVIIIDLRWSVFGRFPSRIMGWYWWLTHRELPRRHGFWPAPLRLDPVPARHYS
jgi:hypothetical protein